MISDFTKEKIGFAVALLAVIFTITPVLDAASGIGFSLFGVTLSVRHLFYLVSASLGLSVYCYGVQFLTERDLRPARTLGDALYALALVAPVLYALLAAGVAATELVSSGIKSPVVQTVLNVGVTLFSAVLGYAFSARTTTQLARRETESSVRKLEDQEMVLIRRAEELERFGHNDLAVIESFRAVEAAARRRAIAQGRSFGRAWIEDIRAQLPNDETRRAFERLRDVRNLAAHAIEPVTDKDAREALTAASQILSVLAADAA